jgi:hypothetical protein
VGRCTLDGLPQTTEEFFFHTFAAVVVLQEIKARNCSPEAHNARVKKMGRKLASEFGRGFYGRGHTKETGNCIFQEILSN